MERVRVEGQGTDSLGHSRAVLERMGRAFHVAAGASCLFWRAATAVQVMAAMAVRLELEGEKGGSGAGRRSDRGCKKGKVSAR